MFPRSDLIKKMYLTVDLPENGDPLSYITNWCAMTPGERANAMNRFELPNWITDIGLRFVPHIETKMFLRRHFPRELVKIIMEYVRIAELPASSA